MEIAIPIHYNGEDIEYFMGRRTSPLQLAIIRGCYQVVQVILDKLKLKHFEGVLVHTDDFNQ